MIIFLPDSQAESLVDVCRTLSHFSHFGQNTHTKFDTFREILQEAQLLFPFWDFVPGFVLDSIGFGIFVPDVWYNFAFSKRIRYCVYGIFSTIHVTFFTGRPACFGWI